MVSPKALFAYQNMDENIGRLLVIVADEPQNVRDMREGWEAARLLAQGPDVETLQAQLPEEGRAHLRLVIREAQKIESDFKRGMQIKPGINSMWEYAGVARHAEPFIHSLENWFKRIKPTMNAKSTRAGGVMSMKADSIQQFIQVIDQAQRVAEAGVRSIQSKKRELQTQPLIVAISKSELAKLNTYYNQLLRLAKNLPGETKWINQYLKLSMPLLETLRLNIDSDPRRKSGEWYTPEWYDLKENLEKMKKQAGYLNTKSYVLISAKAYGVRRTKGSYSDALSVLGQAASIADRLNRKIQSAPDGTAPAGSVINKPELYELSKAVRNLYTMIQKLPVESRYGGTRQIIAELTYMNKDIMKTGSMLDEPVRSIKYQFENFTTKLGYLRKNIAELLQLQSRVRG